MAFRRTVFDKVGLFDTTRGRKGAVLASGEDGEMFERIHRAGLRVAFLGDSRVYHKVEAFRCTKKYLRRWRRQTSRNLAIARGVPGGRRVLNVPLYLFPQLIRALLRMLAARVRGPADEAVHREVIVSHFVGTLEGLIETRQLPRPVQRGTGS
jgi:GT2 family glycosyltransferase